MGPVKITGNLDTTVAASGILCADQRMHAWQNKSPNEGPATATAVWLGLND